MKIDFYFQNRYIKVENTPLFFIQKLSNICYSYWSSLKKCYRFMKNLMRERKQFSGATISVMNNRIVNESNAKHLSVNKH